MNFGITPLGMLVLVVPWLLLGWWLARLWVLALPFLFWLAFAWLERVGLLSGTTSVGSALFTGMVGAVFAGLGMLARARLRRRPA